MTIWDSTERQRANTAMVLAWADGKYADVVAAAGELDRLDAVERPAPSSRQDAIDYQKDFDEDQTGEMR
jgi:hypothetical protein